MKANYFTPSIITGALYILFLMVGSSRKKKIDCSVTPNTRGEIRITEMKKIN